jgi:uncharacterized protein
VLERGQGRTKLNLPPGTQVVTLAEVRSERGTVHPPGVVAVVVSPGAAESGLCRIRFADGEESELSPQEVEVRKRFQLDGLHRDRRGQEWDPDAFVIYRVVVGSRAYGLDEDGSDTDRRGIYLPPAEAHWSLYGVPEQIEHKESEECYWELEKFLVLALKANPNVLECLYTPIIESCTPLAAELLEAKQAFLSRLVYQTYSAYVLSQFKKLEHHLMSRGTIRWKHAMHLVRLLLSGITVLREGFVPVRVQEHRERLLSIRRGEVSWSEVDAWRAELHRAFELEFERTALPEWPDYDAANAFLIRARRSMVR